MRSFWLSLLVLCSISAASKSQDAPPAKGGWPEGYELAEDSTSPDGRYGVLLPTREEAAEDEDKITNSLVNLQTHARLGVIHKAHYFPGYNHHGLHVQWADDSSWCVVTFEERYGFGSITLVEPHGVNCTQTDLGDHIQKSLDAVIARQSKGGGGSCGTAYFRPIGRKLVVRATDQTNPKAFDDVPTYCASFLGTFDLKTKKWTRSEGLDINLSDRDLLEPAYSDNLEDNRIFDNDADRLKFYDDKLNNVYRGIRLLLPAARFAAVKKQQLAWIKTLEAAGSDSAKIKLIAQRIGELQQLAWEP
jgi:hypothetical protein